MSLFFQGRGPLKMAMRVFVPEEEVENLFNLVVCRHLNILPLSLHDCHHHLRPQVVCVRQKNKLFNLWKKMLFVPVHLKERE